MQIPRLSLCAIVRDEVQNPAGGIADYLAWTLPFVEQAVVVDTGSRDGTREVLEEAKKYYPHLQVYDHPFEGFAASRNYALEQVGTEWVLVLDADERLWPGSFTALHSCLIKQADKEAFEVGIDPILPESESLVILCEQGISDALLTRVFRTKKGFMYRPRVPGYLRSPENLYRLLLLKAPKTSYGRIAFLLKHMLCEAFSLEVLARAYDTDDKEGFTWCGDISEEVAISHFKPTCEGRELKRNNLYKVYTKEDLSPALIPESAKWKELNPLRSQFGPILRLGEAPQIE